MKQWLLRVLERRRIAQADRRYREYLQTDDGLKMQAQIQAGLDGLEIEPPWVVWREAGPFCFGQGTPEYWWLTVWLPFWKELSSDQRIEYAIRWNADRFWRETLLSPRELASFPDLDGDGDLQ